VLDPASCEQTTQQQAATELPCVPASVADSRQYVTSLLTEAEAPPELAEDVRLVVSELATNAIRTGLDRTGLCVGLSATVTIDDLMSCTVTVTDPPGVTAEPLPVAVTLPKADAEHGRGLALVDAFTHAWGSHTNGDGLLEVWAHWSWLSPGLWDRGWVAGWTLTRDLTGHVRAHHPDEQVTFLGGPSLASVRRPIASVNRLLDLRQLYPEWHLTYEHSAVGPTWFTARRRTPARALTHGVANTIMSPTVAGLGQHLAAQRCAQRRAAQTRAPAVSQPRPVA
jgi:anti-sigma regulatory factor (Ser/Thr protein kinase)